MKAQHKYRREYESWRGMRRRCEERNNKDWPRYGGRGIRVCPRWSEWYKGFLNFLADMGRRPEGTTLGRINNSGHYEPSNCRWETSHEQDNNRRSNTLIAWNGETKTVTQWARAYGVKTQLVFDRLRLGWELERALTSPKTKARGANAGTPKLTDEKVLAMRADHAAGATMAALGRKYGVSWPTVKVICTRAGWRHI